MSNGNRNSPSIYKIIEYAIIILAALLVIRYLYQNSSLYFRKTFTMPLTLHLNTNDLYLIKGEEDHIFVYDINKRVSFSSTNFRVAGVNFNGRVFGYQIGKAFIIAKVGKRELRCRVHVIDINTKHLKLSVGETYKLKILGANSFIRWSSKNRKIVSVSMFGRVEAKAPGTTIIYAKVKGKKLRCEIKVR